MSIHQHSNFIDSRTGGTTSLSQAIITSQPQSGGLWSPQDFPQFSEGDIGEMSQLTYQELAYTILSRFDLGVDKNVLSEIIEDAYGNQWHNKDITPVKDVAGNLYSLHLGYGPTFAFKNVALEFLPRLLTRLVPDKIIHVLGASSGDTINAAHSGVKGTNINSLFMLPNVGPSVVQALQAKNGISQNPNAITLLANATFDPLQDIVKKINSPEFSEFKQEHNITSFNSINIARILAQVVYYFRAYAQLIKQGGIKNGEEVIFSVPSGNFGDALAGYYAKKMGLPIKKIHIATNENNMLENFIETGIYEPPKQGGKDYVQVTNAPSMDIAKSSNFERMLFDITGLDSQKVNSWYKDLAENGRFQIDSETLVKVREIFSASSSTDEYRMKVIEYMGRNFKHGIDPHTAAAVAPFAGADIDTPVIFLETSHVAQFGEELRSKGLLVPGMNEFDDILEKMRKNIPIEGSDYLNVRGDFNQIFSAIQKGFQDIFPEKRRRIQE